MENNSISLIAGIRERAYSYISYQLEKAGIEGIVPTHGDILCYLAKEGCMTKSQIAEKIGREKPTVTTLIEKLIKYGYITERGCTIDTRRKFISLTEKGKEFRVIMKKISAELFEKEFEGVSEEEREIFMKVLEKIYNNFG